MNPGNDRSPCNGEVEKLQRALLNAELRNAELQNRIRLLEAEIGVFREIGKFSGDESSFYRVMEDSLQRIKGILGAEAGTIFLLTPTRDELIFEVVIGPDAEKLRGKRIPIDKGIAGWVVRKRSPYISLNVKDDPFWFGEFTRDLTLKTENIICVPIEVGEDVFGAIELINKENGEAFTKGDLEVLTLMARHLAILIQNMRSIIESRRKAEQFKTLLEIGGIINSTLDAKAVRKKAIEAATKLMNTEVGSLLLVDEKTNELYFEVALGDKGEKVKEIRLKMGQGIAGWVAQTGQPVIVQDAQKDPRFFREADKKSQFVTKNMICVPVKLKGGKVIGVLQAINKLNDEKYTEEDLELFEALANQVAIAIENARLYEEIRETFIATAEALAEAIEKRDPYTGGHTKRVTEFSLAIAEYMGLSEKEKFTLKLAAILHDIGKIGIEDSVLRKQARLTEEEYAKMRMHPVIGAEILKHIEQLKDVLLGTLYHHERYDGRGYPEGLKDGEIPLIARIIAVADTFDAMTSDRPYRKALPDKVALEELIKNKGTQFDPDVVDAFVKAFKDGKIISATKRKEEGKNVQ